MNSPLLNQPAISDITVLQPAGADATAEAITQPNAHPNALASTETGNGSKQEKPLFHGQFQIIKRLGRGGFGTAYLAKDVRALDGMDCVIKQIRYRTKKNAPQTKTSVSLAKERSQRRFQKEARIMARLGRHPQMPCLLDHFSEDGQHYLVQEYIPGHTLSHEIQNKGPLSDLQREAQVKEFLAGMIPVMRYMHRHGLLHLDIKPSNIIRRSADQSLVLIDFGAVKRYSQQDLSTSERCTGTIGFSPAEQLAGAPTPASDIYALGVTCLYLLTGCSPVDFATSPKGQNLRWQESVRVSAHFERILTKMLAPEAKNRYQSIEELERAMKLEEHYHELKVCMTREPFTDQNFDRPEACLLEGYVDQGPKSAAQKQASSIRRWQQRRRQFKSFVPK